MLNVSYPTYLIQSYQGVSSAIKQQFVSQQEHIKELLSTTRLVIYLTYDSQTLNYGYIELLAITTRFIGPNSKLLKCLLTLYKLLKGYASKLTTLQIIKIIKFFNLQDRLRYITLDNATYNDIIISNIEDTLLSKLSIIQDSIQYQTRYFSYQVNLALQALFATSINEVNKEANIDKDAVGSSSLTLNKALIFLCRFM